MRKYYLICCFSALYTFISAQALPETEVQITSRNYFDICQQLDAYFADEYQADEAGDCWDNEWVKYQRWRWLWRDRVLPNGDFPDPGAQWLDFQKSKSLAAQADNVLPNWQHEGPNKNAGGGYWGMGRTKHVEFHPTNPDIFYVGTPDGGIWRTTDGGNSWVTLGDELPYLPVGVVRVDFQHPDTLYILLGGKSGWWEYGLGIYKSTDGGQTWLPTGLTYPITAQRVVYELEMSRADPQILIAATNQGIFRTTDGGINWAKVRTGEITDLKQRPGDPNTWYSVLHDYWGNDNVLKSTDGGITWVQTTQFTESQNDMQLAVSPANPDFVGLRMSQGKKFWLSKDAAQSFQYLSELPEEAHIQLSAVDTNIMYTSGVSVFRSDDQGLTWNKITHWYNDGEHAEVHADVHDIVQNPHNTNEVFFCNDGGIYRYNEVTAEWKDHSNGLGIAQFYRIAVSESGFFRLAAGSQDNGGWLRKATSPTANWVHTNGGDAMTQAIDPVNSAIVFTEYYGGNEIYRSTDSYFSSTVISDNLPDDPSGDWVTPFVMNPQRSASMLFGFQDIYRTYDRGDHFEKITNNLTGNVDNKIRDVRYAPSDTNTIVATWGKRTYITSNNGQNWITKTPPGTEDITRVAIHPHQPATFWVCKGGYQANNKVFKTINGGVNWTNLSGNLPNTPVNCILFDSITNYLFLGTDIGVFYSDADQINWQVYGGGIPNVWVLDLQLRNTSRRLYAGTHGRGVYSVKLEEIVATEAPSDRPESLVYPNPAHTVLFFKTAGNQPVSGVLRIMDVHGRAVLTQSLNQVVLAQHQVVIAGLTDGVYFVQVLNQEGQVVLRQQIVKG